MWSRTKNIECYHPIPTRSCSISQLRVKSKQRYFREDKRKKNFPSSVISVGSILLIVSQVVLFGKELFLHSIGRRQALRRFFKNTFSILTFLILKLRNSNLRVTEIHVSYSRRYEPSLSFIDIFGTCRRYVSL